MAAIVPCNQWASIPSVVSQVKLQIFWNSQVKRIQSDQQESKSEQALQIIGHVVAESYANKRSKHGRRQFVVSNASL
jgi:hypothetical protein